tara:strand:- start:90 stop:449 length:360 start_codon:yes stop_codon:yes gene_type:complete
MPKKELNYSDLSKKELEALKDTYIDQKVNQMNNIELKAFVSEHISLQIKSTIGNDEETEAWEEMEQFFKEDFENIIKNIQKKFQTYRELNSLSKDQEEKKISLNIKNEENSQREDMWED